MANINIHPILIKLIGLGFEFFTTFTITWFLVIMLVLPFGIQESEINNTQGFATGAPKNPQIKRKLIITTIISLVITLLIQIIINLKLISFRELIS